MGAKNDAWKSTHGLALLFGRGRLRTAIRISRKNRILAALHARNCNSINFLYTIGIHFFALCAFALFQRSSHGHLHNSFGTRNQSFPLRDTRNRVHTPTQLLLTFCAYFSSHTMEVRQQSWYQYTVWIILWLIGLITSGELIIAPTSSVFLFILQECEPKLALAKNRIKTIYWFKANAICPNDCLSSCSSSTAVLANTSRYVALLFLRRRRLFLV